jgi:hypothetical protein
VSFTLGAPTAPTPAAGDCSGAVRERGSLREIGKKTTRWGEEVEEEAGGGGGLYFSLESYTREVRFLIGGGRKY